MRTSRLALSTTKEKPVDADTVSHQLMLRANLIKQLASGLYTWMPLGLMALQKVEAIIREEINKTGALEILMPAVQPAELWKESGRWEEYGPELLRISDRHDREFCFGPTHEEVITDLAKRELNSYKQLPITYYQIQTKFRDEVRPRFGIMRAREFLMKDAYSFHMTQSSLEETYQAMYTAYSNIFSRLGLEYKVVKADSGAIGGSTSHEFHVLADSGEDSIAFSDASDYAVNIELSEKELKTGDPSPDGKGKLSITKGIEVGHIFQLGDKYSKSMGASVLDKNGKNHIMQMGCYGIGVSRIVAASIEQSYDDNGIIWPDSMAPFAISLIPINMHQSSELTQRAEKLYADLMNAGFSVLFDDRDKRPGVMFADSDLIGIPHRVVISDKSLKENKIEYKKRGNEEKTEISITSLAGYLEDLPH